MNLDSFKTNGYVVVKKAINKKDIKEFLLSLFYLINGMNLKNIKIEKKNIKNFELLKKEILININKLESINHFYIAKLYDMIRELEILSKILSSNKITQTVKKLLKIKSSNPISIQQKACRVDIPVNNKFSLDWHQEAQYTIKDTNLIQIWAPAIHDIKFDNGGLQILKSSHKEGLVKTNDRIPKIGHAQYVPEKKILDKYKNKREQIELSLGDVLLFSKFLIHKSGENKSNLPRLTFIGHYHDISNKNYAKNYVTKASLFKKNSYKT